MNTYDRKIKCLDEPHPPELLEKLSLEGFLNKGKFLTDAHRDSYFQQMLEHSPYEKFVSNLTKMTALSKRYVFISLPFLCAGFSLSVNIALVQSLRLKRKFELYFPWPKRNREYRKEYKEDFPWAVHYWEIRRRGFPLSRIRRDIRNAGLSIAHTFRSENPYHYFILAEKS